MKFILRWKIALCCALLLGYYTNSFARDYYWIGKGANNNWSLPGNWASASGAAVSDVQVPPTLTDNAIFDENSFTTAKKTVIVDATSTCDSIIFRNIQADRIPTLTVNATLTVKGSMFLTAGMAVNGAASQTVQFQSERSKETLATAGITNIYPNFTFTGSANWTIDGSLSFYNNGGSPYGKFTFSSTGNLTVNGNMTVTSFTKTGDSNVDISGYLTTPSYITIYSPFTVNFSGSGDMTVGSYVDTDIFSFSGDGILTINGYLNASNVSTASPLLYRGVYLGGTGKKTINGDLTAYYGIIADSGTVNIQGDLNMNSYNTYPMSLTGANPSVLNGCKMTIDGNIVNNNAKAATGASGGRLSVSGDSTEVEVKGGYATLSDLYITIVRYKMI